MKIQKALLISLIAFSSINSAYAKPKFIEDVWKSEKNIKQATGFYSQGLEALKKKLTTSCRYLPGVITQDGDKFNMSGKAYGCNRDDRKLILIYQTSKARSYAVLGEKVATPILVSVHK